jgi:iron complex transport system substrate-binding protein
MWHYGVTLLFMLSVSGPANALNIADNASSFPIEMMDDRGSVIRLKQPAQRIISLSPNITELIFSAGAGGKLVGVSRYSDYPDAAKSIPNIGDASALDLERIVALQPDLVIVWRGGNAQIDMEKLEKLRLAVFATEATHLEDIPRLLRAIGQLAGTSVQGEQAAATYEEKLQQIGRAYGDHRKIKVFQLIWDQPLMTVNRNHIINDILELCGGTNVFASAPFLTPVISRENLVEADPHVIISSVPLDGIQADENILERRFPNISAIRNRHLFFVPPDLIHRPTVRLLRAARMVCEQLESVRAGGRIGKQWKALQPVLV